MRETLSTSYGVSLSLDLFSPHFLAPTFEEIDSYSHPCRCSSLFIITIQELEAGIQVVECQGCSSRCRVEYDVIEETE